MAIPEITASIPEDKGIVLKDILEDASEQSGAIRGRYNADGKIEQRLEVKTDGKSNCLTTVQKDNVVIIEESIKPSVAKNIEEQHLKIEESLKDIYRMDCTSGWQDNVIGLNKAACLRAGNSSSYVLDNKTYRKLTVVEAERLQTIPDNFTEGVSSSQRYKMLGNSWTIDVVAHLFKGLADD